MQWKSVLSGLSNPILIFAAVILGVRFFSPDVSQQLQTVQKPIDERIQEILNHIKDLSSTENMNKPSIAFQPPSSSGVPSGFSQSSLVAEINNSLQEINQSLRDIFESLQRIENTQENIPIPPVPDPTRIPGGANEFLRDSKPVGPIAWIEDLPEAKRIKVEAVFREQRGKLRAQYSSGFPSDPLEIKKIMEKDDQELKAKLKAVLSDDEYQSFIRSTQEMRKAPLPSKQSTN